jgi:hypothetical protein
MWALEEIKYELQKEIKNIAANSFMCRNLPLSHLMGCDCELVMFCDGKHLTFQYAEKEANENIFDYTKKKEITFKYPFTTKEIPERVSWIFSTLHGCDVLEVKVPDTQKVEKIIYEAINVFRNLNTSGK